MRELVDASGRFARDKAADRPPGFGKAAIPIIVCERVSDAEAQLGRRNWRRPFPYTFVAPALVDAENAQTYFANGLTVGPAIRIPLARIIRNAVARATAESAQPH